MLYKEGERMLYKKFAQRLNHELDSLGVPEETTERIAALSKWLKIPKFKAEALLDGLTLPDEALLVTLTEEFEVNADWLLGKSDTH